ncbi:MAG: hypothetical protein H6R10_254 [Rhodocyclaceae bacterium]|nr:hypothetical protein [Rhodocyclaceae bacterium]
MPAQNNSPETLTQPTGGVTVPAFEYGFYDQCLRESYEKFGGILDLPIVDSPYSEARRWYASGNVLDIGAGRAHALERVLDGALKDGRYYSLDTDPRGQFDFAKVQEIPDDLSFSLIVANQVFEHLTIDTSLEVMAHATAHMAPGASIVATVPNVAHPNRFMSNITHVTYWGHHSFYMLFKAAGLEVKNMARYSKVHPRGLIERLFARYAGRIYRMDWCDSLLVRAVKHA